METINLDKIIVSDQPRKDFSAVEALAESIKHHGLIQPLILCRTEGGKLYLVDGEQRMRALKKLKIKDAPCTIVYDLPGNDMSEDSRRRIREIQITANLVRTDLALIERMRGFAMLLENAPAKYNEKVIANKFGCKAADVSKCVRVVRKIDPKMDEALASGKYDFGDIEFLSSIPKEFQGKLVEFAMKGSRTLANAATTLATQLFFDDVFNVEKARGAGKIHFSLYGHHYTFDKDYARKVKQEFEGRTNKKYEPARAKASADDKRQMELAEQKKKKAAVKKKEDFDAGLKDLRAAIEQFRATTPQPEEIAAALEREVDTLWAGHMKILLRAFGVEFKAADCSTADLRRLVRENIFGDVKTSHQVVTVQSLLRFEPRSEDPKEWAKTLKKALLCSSREK